VVSLDKRSGYDIRNNKYSIQNLSAENYGNVATSEIREEYGRIVLNCIAGMLGVKE
jgi:hypothetical protein